MKPIALAAILVLSLLLVPTVFALEQSIQTAKPALSRLSVQSTFLVSGAVIVPNDPGSGGGGQGVICNYGSKSDVFFHVGSYGND